MADEKDTGNQSLVTTGDTEAQLSAESDAVTEVVVRQEGSQEQPSSSVGEEEGERDSGDEAQTSSEIRRKQEEGEEEEKKEVEEEEEGEGEKVGGSHFSDSDRVDNRFTESGERGGGGEEGGKSTERRVHDSGTTATATQVPVTTGKDGIVDAQHGRPSDSPHSSLVEQDRGVGGGEELEGSFQSSSELGRGSRSLEHSVEVYSTVVSPHMSRSTQSPLNTLSLEEEMVKAGEGGEGEVREGEGRKGKEGVVEGEEEAGEGVPVGKKKRKVHKSQLLQSAGIHLQAVEPLPHGSPLSGSSVEGKGEVVKGEGEVVRGEGEVVKGEGGEEGGGVPQKSEDRNLEQFSEILLDSDLSPTDSETSVSLPQDRASEVAPGEETQPKAERRVRFADEVDEAASTNAHPSSRPETLAQVVGGGTSNGGSPKHPGTPVSPSLASPGSTALRSPSAPHAPDEIIAGVEYSAEYLGSTPILLTGAASAKSARMQQAQQVVKLFKDPENDTLPRFAVKVKISSQCIRIADSKTDIDLMDHPLYTISYVADIENVLVVMINRIPPPAPPTPQRGRGGDEEVEEVETEGGGVEEEGEGGKESREGEQNEGGHTGGREAEMAEQPERDGRGGEGAGEKEEGEEEGERNRERESDGDEEVQSGPIPRMTCHVLETSNARHVAMVIGQAFSVAYKEFLRANGISEDALEEAEYAHVLNAQSAPQAELDLLRDRNKIRKLTIPKHKGDMLGLMVMDSGYGSAVPTPVIAHMSKAGSAARSGLLNIGDHIISINGVNMVGMPVKVCIEQVKKCRYLNVVKMTVVSCSTVVDITIVRPDLKYQLGFTVQDGVVCSLMRGSIAERSGVRVGHYIIEINGTSTVGITHKDLVHLLTTTVGDLHLKTMPHLMYRLITGQMQPLYH